MQTIDLNSDMGEYDDQELFTREVELMPLITSANIACGGHAGTPDLMRRTAGLATQQHVAIGAHPGFPDAGDFGRGERQASPDEVASLVSRQLTTLAEVLACDRLSLTHVKPHGALYSLTAKNPDSADALAQAVVGFDPRLMLFALAGSALVERGRSMGLTVMEEAFADRAYRSDGTLVPRTQPGAVLPTAQHVVRQLREILNGYVTSIDGHRVPLHADTLCVHVDTPHAVDFVRLLRAELQSAGVRIQRPLAS
ncbi:MAG: LamB/YcsF family protein [Nitrospira sp.]|nr:LamB/YcsF family protein [Nitrospira sp.]